MTGGRADRRATAKQMAYIDGLAQRAGYRHQGDAIRAALGKHPIHGLTVAHAGRVIDWLRRQ